MLCILGHAGSVECKLNSAEWQVWKKSQQCDGFPHRDVIDEFLTDKDKLPAFALVWKRPKMFHLMVNNMYLCILYVYLLFVITSRHHLSFFNTLLATFEHRQNQDWIKA